MEEVKKNFNACKQFFNREIEARVVAAALKILELSSTTDKPAENLLPHSLEEASLAVKKKITSKICPVELLTNSF